MTNLIALADAAIFLLPVVASIGFVTIATARSLRRFAW
jgi:hypothetical protein